MEMTTKEILIGIMKNIDTLVFAVDSLTEAIKSIKGFQFEIEEEDEDDEEDDDSDEDEDDEEDEDWEDDDDWQAEDWRDDFREF